MKFRIYRYEYANGGVRFSTAVRRWWGWSAIKEWSGPAGCVPRSHLIVFDSERLAKDHCRQYANSERSSQVVKKTHEDFTA